MSNSNCSEYFKISHPIRNLLLPILVFVVVEKLFGFLFYMNLFKDIWTPFESIWRPMDKDFCLKMTVIAAFYAFFISFLYTKACEKAKKRICIFGFAFAMFLVGRFIGEIYGFIMYPYSFDVMLLGMGHGITVMFFWALISQKIFVIKE